MVLRKKRSSAVVDRKGYEDHKMKIDELELERDHAQIYMLLCQLRDFDMGKRSFPLVYPPDYYTDDDGSVEEIIPPTHEIEVVDVDESDNDLCAITKIVTIEVCYQQELIDLTLETKHTSDASAPQCLAEHSHDKNQLLIDLTNNRQTVEEKQILVLRLGTTVPEEKQGGTPSTDAVTNSHGTASLRHASLCTIATKDSPVAPVALFTRPLATAAMATDIAKNRGVVPPVAAKPSVDEQQTAILRLGKIISKEKQSSSAKASRQQTTPIPAAVANSHSKASVRQQPLYAIATKDSPVTPLAWSTSPSETDGVKGQCVARQPIMGTKKGSALPPLETEEYDTVIPTTDHGLLMIQVSNKANDGTAMFAGCIRFPECSKSPAELHNLCRNIGDSIIAIDGVSVVATAYEEIVGLLRERCKNKHVHIRFRSILINSSPTTGTTPSTSSARSENEAHIDDHASGPKERNAAIRSAFAKRAEKGPEALLGQTMLQTPSAVGNNAFDVVTNTSIDVPVSGSSTPRFTTRTAQTRIVDNGAIKLTATTRDEHTTSESGGASRVTATSSTAAAAAAAASMKTHIQLASNNATVETQAHVTVEASLPRPTIPTDVSVDRSKQHHFPVLSTTRGNVRQEFVSGANKRKAEVMEDYDRAIAAIDVPVSASQAGTPSDRDINKLKTATKCSALPPALPPLVSGEYDTVIPTTDQGLLMMIMSYDISNATAKFSGYTRFPEGSKASAELHNLCRNIGDSVIAVDGVSVVAAPYAESVKLLHERCTNKHVHLRFRSVLIDSSPANSTIPSTPLASSQNELQIEDHVSESEERNTAMIPPFANRSKRAPDALRRLTSGADNYAIRVIANAASKVPYGGSSTPCLAARVEQITADKNGVTKVTATSDEHTTSESGVTSKVTANVSPTVAVVMDEGVPLAPGNTTVETQAHITVGPSLSSLLAAPGNYESVIPATRGGWLMIPAMRSVNPTKRGARSVERVGEISNTENSDSSETRPTIATDISAYESSTPGGTAAKKCDVSIMTTTAAADDMALGASLPPLAPGEYETTTKRRITISIKKSLKDGAVTFEGCHRFPNGSKEPAELQHLCRNTGDKLLAINGRSILDLTWVEQLRAISDTRKLKQLCLRFRSSISSPTINEGSEADDGSYTSRHECKEGVRDHSLTSPHVKLTGQNAESASATPQALNMERGEAVPVDDTGTAAFSERNSDARIIAVKGVVLPPLAHGEYYEATIPTTKRGFLMIKLRYNSSNGITSFNGYERHSNGSKAPAELHQCCRNIGDQIIAVDGVSMLGKDGQEIFALLFERGIRSKEVCIRFRAKKVCRLERRLRRNDSRVQKFL
jgi:hypothetical protein